MIILFGPGTEFHAETLGTASVADCRKVPNRRLEAMFTLLAAKRKNPNDTAEPGPDAAYLRKAQLFRSALRTGNKSHFQPRKPRCIRVGQVGNLGGGLWEVGGGKIFPYSHQIFLPPTTYHPACQPATQNLRRR